MICHFYLEDTCKFIGHMEAWPVCGKDFCDRCGDCLACYGDYPCYPCHGEDEPECNHFWLKYVSSYIEAERIAKEYESEFIRA